MVGFAAQILDLALHAGDLGLLFGDLRLERVFGFELGLVAHRNQVLLHLLLDREFDLALGDVEFTLLAEHLGLGLLSFGKLGVVRGEQVLQLGKLPIPTAEIVGRAKRALFASASAMAVRSTAILAAICSSTASRIFASSACVCLKLCFAATEVGLLGRKLRLELLARGGDQRRRKGFRQLDLSSALACR